MNTNKLVSGHLTTLTGDPVDIGRGLTPEASQQLHREQNPHLYERGLTSEMLYVDDAPWVDGTDKLDPPSEESFRQVCKDAGVDPDVVLEPDNGEFFVPGLAVDAVAPDGVDAGKDDSGCESGACKL